MDSRIKLTRQYEDRNFWYEFTNKEGDRIVFNLWKTHHSLEGKNSLPKIWKKEGWTDRLITDYWVIETYANIAREINGIKNGCWGFYNPQIMPNENKINFEWMLEPTEENKEKIINKIVELAGGIK